MIERRYIDADYRDEHSKFYSTTFRRYPSVAHRVHFFADAPPAALSDPDVPYDFQGLTYLGYTVLRPVPGAPVGRTVLRVPDRWVKQVTCTVEETVNVFGVELKVKGTPFMAQDAQLSRCAHTTTWVAAYINHRRFTGPRVLPGAIADAVVAAGGLGRSVPSPGLTMAQMSETCRAVELPPLVYPLQNLAEGETIPRVLCRYLNSGIPVIVVGRGHAFVVVGYGRERNALGEETLYFVRQDDEVGPYERIDHWALDPYSPWQHAIVPLPQKVYLAGEDAETIGVGRLRNALHVTSDHDAKTLLSRWDARDVTVRSSVVTSNEFKRDLARRGMPPGLRAVYSRLPMSRYVWVVELQDRRLRDEGAPSVLAEAVVDATDHPRDPHALAWRVPGLITAWLPDEDRIAIRREPGAPPLWSGGRQDETAGI